MITILMNSVYDYLKQRNHTTTFLSILCMFVFCVSCGDNATKLPIPTQDFCASIHRNDTVSLTQEFKVIDALLSKKTGVYVLEDGGGALVTRAWLSEYAEKTIDIQYFIFSVDNIGLIACDYLVRAADRGVQVRILVDDIMVEAGPRAILMLASHPNIHIKIYNPGVNLGKNIFSKGKKMITDFRGANQRMHNKTFTVDGKVAITGGRNVADEYFDFDSAYNFRDRDILILGKTVRRVQESFVDFWEDPISVPVDSLITVDGIDRTAPDRFEGLHQYACDPANFTPRIRDRITQLPKAFAKIRASGKLIWLDENAVHFVSDVPGKNEGKDGLKGGGVSTDSLVGLVKRATQTITIQTPYLITTEESRALFKSAVDRGVKIRILTNSLSSTDNLEAFSGYQRDRKALLQTGVKVYEFRPDAAERYKVMTGSLDAATKYNPVFGLHAKSMVIDGVTTVIGTFNLDPRSSHLNTECITIIESKQIATGVLEGMEQEFQPENSWETTLESNPDEKAGISKRVKTWTRKLIPKAIL